MSIEIRGRLYICIGRKFEISLEATRHKNERSAHAQNIIPWQRRQPSYEVKNPCFLIDPSCCLPFKEDGLREGEWACYEYN